MGANVFIGNLDPEIDEKLLYDIFSAFGVILQTPKVSFMLYFSRKEVEGTGRGGRDRKGVEKMEGWGTIMWILF